MKPLLLRTLLCLCIIVSLASNSLSAQSVQGKYEGKEFWAAIMPPFSYYSQFTLYFTSRDAASVTITTPAISGGLSETINIPANGAVHYQVPNIVKNDTMYNIRQQDALSNRIRNTGLKISSTEPISVYAVNAEGGSMESTMLLPLELLGADYLTMNFNGEQIFKGNSEFLVLATEAGSTQVNFNFPTAKKINGQSTSSISKTLAQGQIFVIESRGHGNDSSDISGTRITSTKKIAVFSGSKASYFPTKFNRGGYTSCSNADIMMEMLPPVNLLNKDHILFAADIRGNDKPNINYVKVVAAEPGTTTVTIPGQTPIVLNGVGDYKEGKFTANTILSSDKKILLFHITAGYMCSDSYINGNYIDSDPFEIQPVPVANWGSQCILVTPCDTCGGGAQSPFRHFVTIIKEDFATNIKMDGTLINGWFKMPGANYYFKNHISVSSGKHLFDANGNFMVYSYGYGWTVGYGHPVSPSNYISPAVALNLLSFTAKHTGHSVTLNWEVTNDNHSNFWTVEKSSDGISFKAMSLQAKLLSSSSKIVAFTLVDPDPFSKTYYRLKRSNPEIEYSSIVSAEYKSKLSSYSISSLSDKDELLLSINSGTESSVNVIFYDLSGRKLLEKNYDLIEGKNSFQINTSHLSQGIYNLQLTAASGEMKVLKFFK